MTPFPEQPDRLQVPAEPAADARETRRDLNAPTPDLAAAVPMAGLSAADHQEALDAWEYLKSVKSAMAEASMGPDSDDELPPFIGRYRIHRSLGRGGFSEVFLGEDESLQRYVAIKVPLVVGARRCEYRARFEREAMASALLTHPNIVPIYEFQIIGPLAFIAYRWLPGTNLAEYMREHVIDVRTAVAFVAQLADAMQYAHQRGVIHRDLKPANILVDQSPARGDDSVAERLMITDFGLAHWQTENEPRLTREGTAIGTPAYMSPEQAAGSSTITPASDVYSLGVILFELLTGEVPFKRDTTLGTLRAVQEEDPPSLQRRNRLVPPDLQAICFKCLQKSPSDRYGSAYEFSCDLHSWLDGFPIQARHPSRWGVLRAWGKRNPALATLSTFAIALFVMGLAGTTWQWRRAERHAEQFRLEVQRADASRLSAQTAADNERLQRVRAERIADFLGATFRSIDPARQGRDVKVVEVLSRAEAEIAEQFKDDPQTRWRLCLQLARAWKSLGQFQDALRILQAFGPEFQAADHDDKTLAVEYWEVISLVENGLGQYRESLDSVQKAIGLAESDAEIPRELEWRLKRNKANNLGNLGQFVAANVLRQEAVNYYETNPETKPETLLEVQIDWVVGLVQTKEYSRAEEQLRLLLPMLEQSLGATHATTLLAKNMLTRALMSQGKTAGLLELHFELLEVTLDKFGEEHPESLRAMHNLGALLKRERRLEESRDLFLRAATLAAKVHGPASVYRAVTLIELARAERDLGDLQQSAADFRDAVGVLQVELDPLHQRTVGAWIEWLDVLEAAEQWSTAEAVWTELLELEVDVSGPDTLLAKTALFRQGILAMAQGQVEKGSEKAQAFLEYIEQQTALPDRDRLQLKCYATLLAVLLRQGETVPAAPLAQKYSELAQGAAALPREAVLAQCFLAVTSPTVENREDWMSTVQGLLDDPAPLDGLLHFEKQALLQGIETIASSELDGHASAEEVRSRIQMLATYIQSLPNRFR
jgi:tetratricopeptide (TPR) repeat protein